MNYKKLLAVCLISHGIQAKTIEYNHNFLRTRQPAQDRSIVFGALQPQVDRINEDQRGGKLQILGFYQGTRKATDTGKYFGIFNSDTNLIENYMGVSPDISEFTDPGYFLHINGGGGGTNTLHDRVLIDPERKAYGARIDFVQDFEDLIQGFSLRVSVPVMQVKTTINAKSILASAAKQTMGNGAVVGLLDYLTGNVTNAITSAQLQSALTKMKFTPGFVKKTGFGDIELAMQYRLIERTGSHVDIAFFGIIPAGRKGKGEFIFEPLTDNGGHFGLGGNLNVNMVFRDNGKIALEGFLWTDYRYLFKAKEMRCPNVLDAAGATIEWGQYDLAGKNNQINVPLFPLANVLTRDYKVKPGQQFEVVAAFSLEKDGIALTTGAGLFAFEQEKVEIDTWEDNAYAIASKIYSTATAFDETNSANIAPGSIVINKAQLLLKDIETPELFQFQVFASLSCTREVDDYVASFSAGVVYDFYAMSNVGMKFLTGYIKGGVNF